MATIGFLGLGNMGAPMAHNLIEAGHTLKVFDVVPAALEAFEGKAQCCADPTDVCKDVDIVISMLPSGKIVEDLYIHDTALLNHITKSTLIIDCSTVSPENSIAVANAAKEKGLTVLDAPVSGGVGGATAGTLTFIVGGDKDALERAEPILNVMGKAVFHAGKHGAGQMAKICNNMLLAVHMIGTAEALQLGVNNGLDPAVLSDIMLQSSGRNWSLEVYNPYPGVMDGVPASREYEGGFAVNLMSKDLGLAMASVEQSDSETPMGKLATELYDTWKASGNGGLDFASIQRAFTDKTA
jgi:3-hydroxyisobutyrate dehydrogenase